MLDRDISSSSLCLPLDIIIIIVIIITSPVRNIAMFTVTVIFVSGDDYPTNKNKESLLPPSALDLDNII